MEDNNTKHIITKYKVKDDNNFICRKCPCKLYVSDNRNVIFGIGNISARTIFILPNYDTRNNVNYMTLLDLLEKEYEKLTGFNMLEQVYVTRLIKCYTNSQYDINKSSVKLCINYLYKEFSVIRPEKVIFFGDSYYNYIQGGGRPFEKVIECYSPGVLYYEDETNKQVFREQLEEALK